MATSNFVPLTKEEIEQRHINEYAFLQRQFRMASNDASAYSSESRAAIRRQEALLRQLHAIKLDVMTNLTVAKNPANIQIDDRNMAKISELLKDGDELDEAIRKKRTEIKEIDAEIQKVEMAIKRLRPFCPSDKREWEESLSQRRRELRLDNQLNAETKRFAGVLADNQRLREQADHFVKERKTFNLQYNRLVGMLEEGKKVMADLIELASVTYNQREESKDRLTNLVWQGKRDEELQTEVMGKIVTQLYIEKQLKEFVATKAQRRVLVSMEQRCAAHRERDKRERKALVAHYQNILKNITEFAQETDIDLIAARVDQLENTNFNVFVYALAFHELVEEVRRDINVLDAAVIKEKTEEKVRAAQRRSELYQMGVQKRKLQHEADQAAALVEQQRNQLQRTLASVTAVFEQVHGDRTMIDRKLLDNRTANTTNNQLYLAEIENKMMRLMAQCNYIESKTVWHELPFQQRLMRSVKQGKWRPTKLSMQVPTQPCAICTENIELCNLQDAPTNLMTRGQVLAKLHRDMRRPDFEERMHNLSACRMPRSKKILTRRYL